MCASALARTCLTIFCGEANLDDFVVAIVESRRPTDAGMSLGTDGMLALPIKNKLTRINSLIGIGLPSHISKRRANHLHPKTLTACGEDVRGHVARVQQMLVWQ